VTQATNLHETKLKIVFDSNCDHLAPNMAIILPIHALHLQRLVNSWKNGWQYEKDISIENNQQELNFLKRYRVIIQILQLIGGTSKECHNMEVRNNKLNTTGQARRLW
jgi:hypothetical protein